MIDRKKAFLAMMLVLTLLLGGCGGMINSMMFPPAKVQEMAKSPEEAKKAAVEKNIGLSRAHDILTKHNATIAATDVSSTWKAGFKKPEIDYAALKNVKKAAIVGFHTTVVMPTQKVESGGTTFYSIDRKLADSMHDELKAALEKQGIEVVAPEKITGEAAYQSLPFEEEETELKAGSGVIRGMSSAYGLKAIPMAKVAQGKATEFDVKKKDARLKEKIAALQKVAKALGADALIVASHTIFMEQSGFTGKTTIHFGQPGSKSQDNSFAIELLSADQPNIIWSASMSNPISVPTDVKEKSALLGVKDFNVAKVTPDIVNVYRDIADLVAFKLAMDQKK